MVNAARCYWLADHPALAEPLSRRATALAPSDFQPAQTLGNVLRDLNRFEEADQCYEAACELEPTPWSAWNRSVLLQGLQRYGHAFSLAERRFELLDYQPLRSRDGALLRGPSLKGRSLVLWSEQGFGDCLQHLRWIPLLAELDCTLVVELESSMVTLFQEGFAWLKGSITARAFSDPPVPLQEGQEHVSILSLPYVLGDSANHLLLSSQPPLDWQRGYLRSPNWPRRRPSSTPRVGLVWAAGQKLDDPFTAREYIKRSLNRQSLHQLATGLEAQGVDVIPMQIGHDCDWLEQGLPHLSGQGISQSASFAENARWIRDLDLLISVDTAAAHLAGALGHPCWLLLPFSADPRWLRDRSDSPWYPSFRLFRQPSSGQWLPVVDQVLEAFSPWWHSISDS